MYSTRQVILLLQDANPQDSITEDQIRRILRHGEMEPPMLVAGRFVWRETDVVRLAGCLLVKPSFPRPTKRKKYKVKPEPRRSRNAGHNRNLKGKSHG